jgi:hypothetical protein
LSDNIIPAKSAGEDNEAYEQDREANKLKTSNRLFQRTNRIP